MTPPIEWVEVVVPAGPTSRFPVAGRGTPRPTTPRLPCYMGRLIRVAVTLLFAGSAFIAAGCDVEARLAEEAAPRGTSVARESRADSIRLAAIDFVRRETAVSEAEVTIDAESGEWARATVTPADDVTDPATVYLRRSSGTWTAVAIGTAFAPDELDDLGVPAEVRPPR